MSKFCFTLLAAGMLLTSLEIKAQTGKLYPVDEAAEDASFVTFRIRLIEALVKRDTTFIINQLSPEIRNSFGGNDGIDEFRTYWFGDQETEDELWPLLARVLAAGGTFHRQPAYTSSGKTCSPYFYAPYYSAVWPDDVDPFSYTATIGANIEVHGSMEPKSEVLTSLSFDLVQVTDFFPYSEQPDGDSVQWVQVKLWDGQEGFVRKEAVGSAVDYRAVFAKCDGRWVITSFLAGD